MQISKIHIELEFSGLKAVFWLSSFSFRNLGPRDHLGTELTNKQAMYCTAVRLPGGCVMDDITTLVHSFPGAAI
jgi:hypothetical protein